MMLDAAQRVRLLQLARASIEAGLEHGALASAPGDAWDEALGAPRASFVTLQLLGELRGCCGTLEAARPLAEDVWRNAYASAFSDPRFTPLARPEWSRCQLHISVLTAPEPIAASTEQALIEQLRPGRDGLVLQLGSVRSTFLPAVWEQLREPVHFVRQLKLKAGWPPQFWSPHLHIWRYECESFGELHAA